VEEKQTFIQHLEELRKRLIISLIAVGIGFITCYLSRRPCLRGLP
jgi:Sec-independent protein secretion pathway component TatC